MDHDLSYHTSRMFERLHGWHIISQLDCGEWMVYDRMLHGWCSKVPSYCMGGVCHVYTSWNVVCSCIIYQSQCDESANM